MNAKDYAKLVIMEQMDVVYKDRAANAYSMFMDDASPVHGGCVMEDGEQSLLCNGKNAKDYLREDKRTIHIGCPPCFTSRRPNDQRWINAMLRFQYDKAIASLTGQVVVVRSFCYFN